MILFVCSSCFVCSTIQNRMNYQKNREAAIGCFHIWLLCMWARKEVWIAEIMLNYANNHALLRPPVQIFFFLQNGWNVHVQPSVSSASSVFAQVLIPHLQHLWKITTVCANSRQFLAVALHFAQRRWLFFCFVFLHILTLAWCTLCVIAPICWCLFAKYYDEATSLWQQKVVSIWGLVC